MIKRSSFLVGYRRAERDVAKELERYLKEQGVNQVHDLRTAIRRFDRSSALLPASLRKGKRMRRYRSGLRKLLRMNNRIRDIDTIGAALAPVTAQPGLEWLRVLLKGERAALEGPARQLAASIAEEIPDVDLEKVRPRKLQRRFRKLTRRLIEETVHDLNAVMKDPADSQALHSLRIGAKELRYTLELLPKGEAEAVLLGLREWQDALGRIRDIDVMVDFLGGLELPEELAALLAEKVDERRRLSLRFADAQRKSRLVEQARLLAG